MEAGAQTLRSARANTHRGVAEYSDGAVMATSTQRQFSTWRRRSQAKKGEVIGVADSTDVKECPIKAVREKSNDDGTREITLKGASEDVKRLAGALLYGMKWVRLTASGELETSDVYDKAPAPTYDPEMQNIWRFDPHAVGAAQMRLFYDDPEMQDPKNKWSRDHRAIYLQGISGYSGKDEYVRRATLLTEAGFSCLRSRRGDDGKYWEIWYLPDPCCGRGPIKGMKTSDEVKKWIFKNIGPGSVALEGEHWGLSID